MQQSICLYGTCEDILCIQNYFSSQDLCDTEPFEKLRTFKLLQPKIWKMVNAFSDPGRTEIAIAC